MSALGICERCKAHPAITTWTVDDEETGESSEKAVCWDCDFDLTNGRYDSHEDAAEIAIRRAEEDYEYDPLYYPKPSWLP